MHDTVSNVEQFASSIKKSNRDSSKETKLLVQENPQSKSSAISCIQWSTLYGAQYNQ